MQRVYSAYWEDRLWTQVCGTMVKWTASAVSLSGRRRLDCGSEWGLWARQCCSWSEDSGYSAPCGTVVVLCCFCARSGYNDWKIVGRRSPECGRTCTRTHTHTRIHTSSTGSIHTRAHMHTMYIQIYSLYHIWINTYIKYIKRVCI